MKTRIIFSTIMAFIAIIMLSSCEKIKGKGETITETRYTDTYQGIDLAMSATVYYSEGNQYSLQISGQENVLKEIITSVEGGSLVIKVRNGVILGTHEPIRVTVTAPVVRNLDVSGSGDIYVDGSWNPGEANLDISGSGSIHIAQVTASHLDVSISGSGSVIGTSGKVNREELKISGSGMIDLRRVEADTVYSTTSGSGDTYVNVKNLLDVTISGSGNIWYYGNPVINTHISGSGNLSRL